MTIEPVLWGHRGMGATDSAFARKLGAHLIRPPEQSLKSLMLVFNHGAQAFEADSIRTSDDRIVLMHSTRYGEHVAPARHFPDRPFLDQLTLAEIDSQLRLGEGEGEKVPELREVLRALSQKFPDIASAGLVRFNLELKDVQGTPCPRRQPSLCDLVLRDIREVGFPLDAIRFSSFSLDMLAEMREREPAARLALLTDIGTDHGGDVGKNIFGVGSAECYRGFNESAINEAQARLGSGLVAIHPEIRTLTDAGVAHLAVCNLTLATWGWQEFSPLAQSLEGPLFAAAAARASNLCARHLVELVVITDYLEDTRKYLRTLNVTSGPI